MTLCPRCHGPVPAAAGVVACPACLARPAPAFVAPPEQGERSGLVASITHELIRRRKQTAKLVQANLRLRSLLERAEAERDDAQAAAAKWKAIAGDAYEMAEAAQSQLRRLRGRPPKE